MKKISLYSLTALSFIVLAACSAKSTEETSSSSSSEVTSSVSTAKKSKSAGTSQEDVINELKSIFDPNGNSKDFDIKVEKDVKDEAFPNGHTVIKMCIRDSLNAASLDINYLAFLLFVLVYHKYRNIYTTTRHYGS